MKKIVAIGLLFSGILFHCNVFSQRVTPKQQDGKYYFQVANVTFEVDPSFGGRITSFQIGDREILCVTKNTNWSWGSTFWQSPQNCTTCWGWPPSTELDSDPYSGGIAGDSISIVSDVDPKDKIKFRKTFYASLKDTSVTINYSIINTDVTSKTFSPWEISRVPTEGIFLFPYGDGSISGPYAGNLNKNNGIAWYKYKGTETGNQKCMSDGKEGWSAWVNKDSVVFIKKFIDMPYSKRATNENEIEFYFAGPGAYFELENQGPYTSIKGGDSLTWSIKWYLRYIPHSVTIDVNSESLVNFIRKEVKYDTTSSTKIKAMIPDKNFVYPNPVRNVVNIDLASQSANFVLADISGKSVHNSKLNNGANTVSLKKITPGIYFYRLQSEDHISSGKLVIIQ
jgi:hypothetical protein